jgi:hypothetical protein
MDHDDKPTVTALPNNKGMDIICIAPGAFSRLAGYDAAAVDLLAVLISASFEFHGAGPMDLYGISESRHQDIGISIVSNRPLTCRTTSWPPSQLTIDFSWESCCKDSSGR